MKKVVLSFICFICFSMGVKANVLESNLTDYYVKFNSGPKVGEVLNVPKFWDKETGNVVFATSYDDLELASDYTVYQDYDEEDKYVQDSFYFNIFKSVVYYGYNISLTDYNYYLTQVYVLNSFFDYNLSLCDSEGKVIPFPNEYNKLKEVEKWYYMVESFFNKTYRQEIWSELRFTYKRPYPLDNPDVSGLTFKNEGTDLVITPDKVGSYDLTFSVGDDELTKSYYHDNTSFWQSLGSTYQIYGFMNIIVYGTPFKIIEHTTSTRLGDAQLDSNYELYLNDEAKLTLKPGEEVYVKSNSDYVIKDISSSPGFKKSDISFHVSSDSYTLEIDRYVILKNISFTILDDDTYEIYLKSNDELYQTINKDVNKVTLPYGTYYIKGINNDYYEELVVENEEDAEITINNLKEDNNDFTYPEGYDPSMGPVSKWHPEEDYDTSTDTYEDAPQNDTNTNDNSDLPNDEYLTPLVPKTNDNVIFFFLFTIISSILTFSCLKNLSKNDS